uniref:RxLR effector candidate protein n=1 Tax=Panagrellus redivivus TaxID=6233 RepID=A0A7E4V5J9_PANRE
MNFLRVCLSLPVPPITPSSPRFRPSSTPRSIAVASVLLSALLRPSAREADAVSNSTESDTMGEMDAAVNAEAFSQSNRAGRRNAMPDLGIDNVDVGAHKLAEAFSNLGASDAAAGASGQAASSSGAAPAKE